MIIEKPEDPMAFDDEDIRSRNSSFLRQAARRLDDTIWGIKYLISRIEFEIMQAIEEHLVNEELPIRATWKSVRKLPPFDAPSTMS